MNRIKELRLSKNVSQKQLAEGVSLSRPFLCDLEHNRRGAKEETYKRIADFLGVSVDELKQKAG